MGEKKDFQIGDYVKVRNWCDMARENGIDHDNHIRACHMRGLVRFRNSWRFICGHIARISSIDKERGMLQLVFVNQNIDREYEYITGRARISLGMVHSADNYESEIIIPGDEMEIMSFEDLVNQYGGGRMGRTLEPSDANVVVCMGSHFIKEMDYLAGRTVIAPSYINDDRYTSWYVNGFYIRPWMTRKINDEILVDTSEGLRRYLDEIVLN